MRAVARWAEEDGVTLTDLDPEPQRPKPTLITSEGRVIQLHGGEENE